MSDNFDKSFLNWLVGYALPGPEDFRRYERLRTTIFGLISTGLETTGVDFLSIQTRTKTKQSISRKLEEKKYPNGADDMTDIVGARIILYLESDIDRAEEVIRQMFDVDEKKSVDKLHHESSREIGYRSLHLICSLGSRRQRFVEYKGITDLPFEVQIRTALQHAWAEIEHRQNYKSDNFLPPKLERRLMLLSATLENADREFSEIVSHVENYSEMVEQRDPRVLADPISTVSLRAVVSRYVKKFRLLRRIDMSEEYRSQDDFVSILRANGIVDNEKLEKLFESVPLSALKKFAKTIENSQWQRIPQFLLMISDVDRYFASLKKSEGKWYLVEEAWKYLDDEYPELEWRKKAQDLGIEITTQERNDTILSLMGNWRALPVKKNRDFSEK